MVPLLDFYPSIKPRCPQASEPEIDNALIDAAQQFCRASRVIRQHAEPINTVPGAPSYEIETAVGGMEVCEVLSVEDGDGCFLVPSHKESHATQAQHGKPRKFWQTRLGALEVYPVPDISDVLHVTVALSPVNHAQTLSRFLFDRFREGIAAGVLSRLYLNPAHGDASMASAYAGIFEKAISDAATLAEQSFVRARLRTKIIL